MARIQRLGDQGPEVQDLQQKLNTFLIPSPGLMVDGAFGPNTEAAVKAYQRERGLAVDGVVGRQTWSTLASEVIKTPLLRGGEAGEGVRMLQNILNARLSTSNQLQLDGVFGRSTRKAVMRYQASVGIDVDGVVGAETWGSLLGGSTSMSSAIQPRPPVVGQGASWYKIARREMGQREAVGPQEHNPRIIAYHATTTYAAKTDEVPWCSSFVNWVLKESGVEGTNSAAAASWLDWGNKVHAQQGAIVVIYMKNASQSLSSSGNHVGFLVRETSTHYVILGGNQADQVKESSYPKRSWQLKGYRWPAGVVQ